MDSTEVIIARLVLGYLRSEKCRSAYKEFLRTSTNLQDTSLSKSKYVPTRFIGLTLEDILSEYFEISKIVQGRLEATNYYNECHSKNTLVEQLLYLLKKVHLSRTSTPCPRSPPESNLDVTSPSHLDPVSDVETTPVHALPGNIRCSSENSYLHKASRRKLHSKYSKSDTMATIPVTNKDDMSEVLAQTLLENKEFHEKIAQTINKVAEKQYRVSGELDRTIKTVVRETEEDPIFDKILDEIIGSTSIIDANKNIESGSTSSSTIKNNSAQYDNRPKRVHRHSNFNESHDRNYIISGPDSKTMEEQNNEAIQSIVANARLAANTPTDNQENQGNNEVIVFDGSLDKYLISNPYNANTQTPSLQNPLYINASGSLVMVPSAVPTNVTGNIQIDSSKQYYFVNKQPAVSWNLPTIKTPSVITEQDILAMPTVIVNDDKQSKLVTSNSLLQTPVLTTVPTSLQPIIPKPTIEIPAGYMPQYDTTAHDTQTNCKPMEAVHVTESSTISSNTTAKPNASSVKINTKSLPSDLLTENHEEVCEVNKTCQQKVPQSTKEEPHNKTPDPPEPVTKATPKSGSHVRNLDFSTPPKITSTQKKILKSNRNKTPPFVHKKQAAKILFKAQDSTDIRKKAKKTNNSNEDAGKKRKLPATDAWDADLRASVAAGEAADNQTPKKRQKTCKSKKTIKKPNKTGKLKSKLNTTEQDAALLEAALKTPIKDTKNNESVDVNVGNKTEEIKKKPVLSDKDSNMSNIDRKSITDTKVTECVLDKHENLQSGINVTEDISSKTILSPSKLNANKRNLVSDLTDIDKSCKFVTPEMVHENSQHPITCAKNITLLLETPLKTDSIPKTPGAKTPIDSSIDPNLSLSCSIFTPLSKMLEANLKGIDINSLPTPSMPITPNFPPFTPTIDLISPYSNRPTDYSTSSSYYQPSDSEQNKSLEANVMELEKKPINIHSDILIVKENTLVCGSGTAGADVSKNSQEVQKATTICDRLNVFNKSVIGKKNLNLMKRDLSSSSSSSSEDETSWNTSSEDANNSNNWESDSNKTIIQRKSSPDTPKRTYSLRNRTTTINNQDVKKKPVPSAKKQPTKNIKTKQPDTVFVKQVSVHKEEKSSVPNEHITKPEPDNTAQHKLLKELEEKRLRTINKVKNVEKEVPKKTGRPPHGKFLKIKPIPNINTRRKPRKSDSPKKTVKKTTEKIENQTQIISRNDLYEREYKKDEKLSLTVVSNNEEKDLSKTPADKCIKNDKKTVQKTTEKMEDKSKIISRGDQEKEYKKEDTRSQVNNSKNEDKRVTKTPVNVQTEKSEKSFSDVEAQNLIEGLKERGIHLMHNKSSPTKTNNQSVFSPESNLDGDKTKADRLESVEGRSIKNISQKNISEAKENSLSTSEIETELRDIYDTCVFENENEHVVFDETKVIIVKTFTDFDTAVLAKTFLGKVFVEEIGKEIDVPLVFTPLDILLDIPPSKEIIIEQTITNEQDEIICDKVESVSKKVPKDSDLVGDVCNTNEENLKSDDDLMNYAIIGSGREEPADDSDSPKSAKKRKTRSEETSHTEKKCKTLLKKINVDSFLNNIHGGT